MPPPQRLSNCSLDENCSNISTVYTQNRSSTVTCMPHEYGFSDQEIQSYWNYRNYGSCLIKTADEITLSSNLITAYCQDGNYASFEVDNGRPQSLGGTRHSIYWEQGTRKYFGNPKYIIVRCNKNSIYSYVFNRFNSTVSKNSKKFRKSLPNDSKPIAVLLLVFDSISRDSARRNLKNTIEYLKQEVSCGQNISKFSIYDFKLANANSFDTKRSMLPLLYGHSIDKHKELESSFRYTSNRYIQLQEQHAIWSHFSSLGFVTYFSVDTVFDYFSEFTGREIKADHVFQNFWKVAQAVYGYHDHIENQRCFGKHNAHFYICLFYWE